MGDSERARPVELGVSAAGEGVVLSDEPGWNQNHADWTTMLRHGDGFGYRAPGGELVASGIALPYGPNAGWISMVLVTARWRRRGLASALLERCAGVIESRGLVPALDATEDGARVYGQRGFESRLTFTRWRRPALAGVSVAADSLYPVERGEAMPGMAGDTPARTVERIRALDAAVFGDRRPDIVDALIERGGPVAVLDDGNGGFCLSRDGRNARQLGPLVAASPGGAAVLLERAADATDGALVVDAVDAHGGFARMLERAGFSPVRAFTRMVRGAWEGIGDLERCFAVAGPELG